MRNSELLGKEVIAIGDCGMKKDQQVRGVLIEVTATENIVDDGKQLISVNPKTVKEVIIATERLINSVWTAEFVMVDEEKKEIELISYNRENEIGYERERELPQMDLVEEEINGEKRIVTGLLFRAKRDPFSWVNRENCDVEYKVINPKHVFSY